MKKLMTKIRSSLLKFSYSLFLLFSGLNHLFRQVKQDWKGSNRGQVLLPFPYKNSLLSKPWATIAGNTQKYSYILTVLLLGFAGQGNRCLAICIYPYIAVEVTNL